MRLSNTSSTEVTPLASTSTGTSTSCTRTPPFNDSLLLQVLQGGGCLRQLERHRAQHLRALRELDLVVLHDLEQVAERVAGVQEAAGLDLGAGVLQRLACRLLVVHDEAEMGLRLRGVALREGNELVAQVDERHPGLVLVDLDLPEHRAPEGQCLPEIADLERHVIDPNQPGALGRHHSLPAVESAGSCGRTSSMRASGGGNHQFQRPATRMIAGTSRPRMTVASKMIPAARPIPNCLMSVPGLVESTKNANISTSAALVTSLPVRARPSATESFVRPVSS